MTVANSHKTQCIYQIQTIVPHALCCVMQEAVASLEIYGYDFLLVIYMPSRLAARYTLGTTYI